MLFHALHHNLACIVCAYRFAVGIAYVNITTYFFEIHSSAPRGAEAAEPHRGDVALLVHHTHVGVGP